jgi:hypothetical protein
LSVADYEYEENKRPSSNFVSFLLSYKNTSTHNGSTRKKKARQILNPVVFFVSLENSGIRRHSLSVSLSLCLSVSSVDSTGVDFGFQISMQEKSRGFKSGERDGQATGTLHPLSFQRSE